MTAWVNITPQIPSELSPLVDMVDTLSAASGVAVQEGVTALQAAAAGLDAGGGGLASLAGGIIGQVEGVADALFRAGYYQLVVHPYVPGLSGDFEGFKTLTFPDAVTAVTDSFDDQLDEKRPQFSSGAEVEMICLFAGAPNITGFLDVAKLLNQLFKLADLQVLIRRIEQLMRLEQDRLILPDSSTLPDWRSVAITEAVPVMKEMSKPVYQMIAQLRGCTASAESISDEMAAFANRKAQQLDALGTSMQTALGLLSGGVEQAGVHALHVQGVGGNRFLKDSLAESQAQPGNELGYTFGVCWVSIADGLKPLKDLLGI